jgi:hypothetical protein
MFGTNKIVIKNAEFHDNFKSVEKVFKKCTQKVMSKTNLTNMSKRGKSAYFRHILLITFFWYIFGRDLKSS